MRWTLIWGKPKRINDDSSEIVSADGMWRILIWHNLNQAIHGCPFEGFRLTKDNYWEFCGRSPDLQNAIDNCQYDSFMDLCSVCSKPLTPEIREVAHRQQETFVCSAACADVVINRTTKGKNVKVSRDWSRRRLTGRL